MLIEIDQWSGVDALLRHAAENGYAWAMRRLAGLLVDDGMECDDDPELFEEGEAWMRRAADAGDEYARLLLPGVLERLNKAEDAAIVLRQRAATDDQDVLLDVARQLMHLGHDDEAVEVLRRLAQVPLAWVAAVIAAGLAAGGNPLAPARLGHLLRQAGQPEQAERSCAGRPPRTRTRSSNWPTCSPNPDGPLRRNNCCAAMRSRPPPS